MLFSRARTKRAFQFWCVSRFTPHPDADYLLDCPLSFTDAYGNAPIAPVEGEGFAQKKIIAPWYSLLTPFINVAFVGGAYKRKFYRNKYKKNEPKEVLR